MWNKVGFENSIHMLTPETVQYHVERPNVKISHLAVNVILIFSEEPLLLMQKHRIRMLNKNRFVLKKERIVFMFQSTFSS